MRGNAVRGLKGGEGGGEGIRDAEIERERVCREEG